MGFLLFDYIFLKRKTKQWQQKPDSPIATMDHRGLLVLDGAFFILGGMLDNQEVTNNILKVF